jgi:protein-tyrosine phosphatase
MLRDAGVGSNNTITKTEGDHQQQKMERRKRVIVVHCKAGKGRSGTIACSYLICHEGWKKEDALRRFTERRMKGGCGEGVSVPSQVRWVGYVERWANHMDKVYVERPVEIVEIHVWGLRDGVKIAVKGYLDEGKRIKYFHIFRRSERIVVDEEEKNVVNNASRREDLRKMMSKRSSLPTSSIHVPARPTETVTSPAYSSQSEISLACGEELSAIILRPDQPLILPISDVNISFEQRTKVSAYYASWANSTMTSTAHVWFNAYFEGGNKHDSGVFECGWDSLDGIKESNRKGVKALERVKVVWRYPYPASSTTQWEGGGGGSEPKEEVKEAAGPATPRNGNGIAFSKLGGGSDDKD